MVPHQLLLTIAFLLVAINPALTGRYTWGNPSRDWRKPDGTMLPEFETAPSTVTSLIGQTVFLQCHVKNLGDKVVSWIRTRDLHILTSGPHTFTSDARFAVNHKPESDVWTLRIMGAQMRDDGRYECQVNTDPKINFAVNLTVRENDMKDSPYGISSSETNKSDYDKAVSATSILGAADQYVRLGSTVTFTCVVTAPYPRHRPPQSMSWYHGGRLVTFQAQRGGISLDAEKTDVQTTSKLTVAVVTQRDAGNYTCQPTEMKAAAVNLIIIEGERTEAMQRDESNSTPPSCFSTSHYILVTCACLVNWCQIHRYPTLIT